MKHFTRALLLIFLLSATTSFAQTFKFGHINSQELINVMPERDSALVKLDKHRQDLQATLLEISNEYQSKLLQYQQKQATWTAATLEIKQKELQDIQSSYNQFNEKAEYEFQQMRQLLFEPVYQKAKETIEAIGKEQGFTYIFDISTGPIAYFDKDKSTDILPIAKAKLNIPADKVPMQIPQPQEGAPAQ
ncbi:MAG: OmpH family outer membrane protein [Bacteroidales bacterium]|nr:OmpH family outer membrane protein [Bacteroidales bacterium]MDD2425643.1 OmpH family outer membrane protein [Bacteroidales bacterium]MDD3988850.1 OmpH family outer membrane protein [Bacteroidales bacterium]MDD4639500.1 OmpH family outer membrane protein [Bacteroidales bacterium]